MNAVRADGAKRNGRAGRSTAGGRDEAATLRQRNELLTALHETTVALMDRQALPELLQTIITRAAALLDVPHGYIFLVAPGQRTMAVHAAVGLYRERVGWTVAYGEGLAGRIWQSGQPLTVPDYSRWPGRLPGPAYADLHALAGVPLLSGDEVVGVLGLSYSERGRRFDDEQVAILGQFARLASLALEHARLHARAERELAERRQAEAELHRSEERYRRLVETAHEGIWLIDTEQRTAYVNQRMAALLGCTPAALTGASPFAFLDDEHEVDAARNGWLARRPPGGVTQRDVRFRRGDGGTLWAFVSASPLYDDREQFAGTLAMVTDITARRQAEDVLRQSESRFRRLLASNIIGIITADTERVLEANDAYLTMVGCTRADLEAGRIRWRALTAPEYHHLDDRAIAQLQTDGVCTPFEKEYLRTDGSRMPVLIGLAVQEAAPLTAIGFVLDLSARRQAEEALRKSEAAVDLLARQMPGMAWLTDTDLRITDTLGAERRSTWVNEQFADGCLLTDLIDPAGPGAPLLAAHRQALRGKSASCDLPIADQRYCARVEPLRDSRQRIVGCVGAAVDVTAQVRRAEAQRLLAETGALLADSLDYQTTLHNIARLAVPAFADWCAIDALDERGKVRRLAMVHAQPASAETPAAGAGDELARAGAGPIALAAQTGCTQYLPALDGATGATPDAATSVIAVPLVARGRALGALAFVVSNSGRRYNHDDVALVEGLAQRAAIAVDNALLYAAEQRARAEAEAARRRLQALSRKLVDIQEAERRALARELHDDFGQALTGLKLSVELRERGPEPGATPLADPLAQINELIGRVRGLSLNLRPAALDDLGLLPALLSFCKRYTAQTGVRVALHHSAVERRFARDLETTAFRIVQEALTNVARHAGVADVTVWLWSNQDALGVQVADTGVGFAKRALAAGASSGLPGMRERVALLGGTLTIDSAPGRGTRLLAELPLLGPPAERIAGSAQPAPDRVGRPKPPRTDGVT